jgi:nucleotide-binding universal stress UspA family protein
MATVGLDRPVVAEDTEKMPVVLAVDNSNLAFRVVEFAGKHFNRAEYSLILLHVLPKAYPMPYGSAAAAAFEYEASDANNELEPEAAERFLHWKLIPALQRAAPEAKRQNFVIQADSDSSKELGAHINKFADETKAAMIVMANHSKTSLTEFFLGSVTSYCVQHATQPVVILHGSRLS